MELLKKIFFLKPIANKIFRLLTRRQKSLMLLMFVLIIGLSFVEAIGISAILPFISVVSDPSVLESGHFKTVYDFFGFNTPQEFIITFGIIIIIFYFFRGGYSILVTYLKKRYVNSIYKYYAKKALKLNLFIPYKVYAQKNTGELMQAIHNETKEISKVVLHLLTLFSELITVIMIYSVLIIINWKMTLIVTAILLFIVVIMMLFITKINAIQGKKKFKSARKLKRTLKEALANYKYVKLKGSEDKLLDLYKTDLDIIRKAELTNHILNVIPRSILETISFSFLISVMVFFVWLDNDVSTIIPMVTIYAFALFRIIPSIHRLLHEINGLVFSEATIKNVFKTMRQVVEIEGEEPIHFENSIRLENIHFQYITGKEVITDISVEIKKGEKVAFVGESGSGKSTLIDIITGIHKPVSGSIYIDDMELTNSTVRSWRKKIGYIPQTIYLFDGTVADNVSFGSTYDEEKIKTALIKANIWDFLSQKDGINTRVGDAGVQLSGGQQQRICIARALYDDPEILILDEATSALDNETEEKIMSEIYCVSANKTLIAIAHRLSTVERCDRKICIENGRIARNNNGD